VAHLKKEIMLVVGEASGDAHGAHLVEALHQRDSALKIYGVAGEQLLRTNFEALFSVAQLTGMGLVELFGNLGNLWRAYRLLKRVLAERRPNLLVLIDFPDFNLRLARIAKSLRIPVLYYVSPQIWAWRKGRVRQIARWVNQIAVIFPFEVSFYERYGVKATFVGYPLLDSVKSNKNREMTLREIGLDPSKITIALLPGSRNGEVRRHLPIMRDAALRLNRERATQFFCVCASTIDAAEVAATLETPGLQIPVVQKHRYDAIHSADLVWTASGTATLESGLLGRPMIIVYRLSWLTYGVARLLVKVQHIGMVNLILGERVIPELVQGEVNPERIVSESRILLDNGEIRSEIETKLAQLRERLGGSGAAERVADLAIAMLAQESV
jgi:lipid-A-disaccharide synthase